jgi:hypothetical protein
MGGESTVGEEAVGIGWEERRRFTTEAEEGHRGSVVGGEAVASEDGGRHSAGVESLTCSSIRKAGR